MMGRQRQGGFTIIELLIATTVFAMVLILITVGVLSFTKAYYKGVNQSNTQNAARTILEQIAQSIQFSGDTVTAPIGTTGNANGDSRGFCIGNQRYSYALSRELWDDGTPNVSLHQSRHALVMDKGNSCAGMSAQDLTGTGPISGTELLQPRMRVSKLSVEPLAATGLYKITIRIVYGDDDLLLNPDGDSTSCKVSISGAQYCAQSELSTVVKKRIAQ